MPPRFATWQPTWMMFNNFCLGIYTVEMVMRIIGLR